jgi:2-dehydro-3-deoxyphosphogluconate aldolase/(4S)-4-hydroxy-2-oxoglutarate aldolase
MTAKTVSDIVRLGPVIPVLAFDSVEQGEHVSRALHAGGVKVLEITLRTAAGLECTRPRKMRACRCCRAS